MGFESPEQAAKFAEMAKRGFSPDEWLAQQKRVEQPEESVPNVDRRRKGVLERTANATSKESVMRERSIIPMLMVKPFANAVKMKCLSKSVMLIILRQCSALRK